MMLTIANSARIIKYKNQKRQIKQTLPDKIKIMVLLFQMALLNYYTNYTISLCCIFLSHQTY